MNERDDEDDGQSERRSTEQAEEDCPSDLGIQYLAAIVQPIRVSLP